MEVGVTMLNEMIYVQDRDVPRISCVFMGQLVTHPPPFSHMTYGIVIGYKHDLNEQRNDRLIIWWDNGGYTYSSLEEIVVLTSSEDSPWGN